jgi:hypothetical protein
VQDVLYKQRSTSAKTIMKGISNDENSSESDDDNDEDTTTEDFSNGFQVAMTEKDDTIELTDYLQPLIAKVCIVVKCRIEA